MAMLAMLCIGCQRSAEHIYYNMHARHPSSCSPSASRASVLCARSCAAGMSYGFTSQPTKSALLPLALDPGGAKHDVDELLLRLIELHVCER